VAARDSHEQQQAPQRNGPAGDPIGTSTDALDRSAQWPAAPRRHTFGSHPAALDALAHVDILDFGPPSTGLGSHCHR